MATVTPDITILMSTYNRRKYLPSMLKDLLAQTFTNWRLIVVNDGGDDVEDIVKSFNDDRMEYYNRPHLGKPAQLNFALRMVESKYIGYLDDDDNVLPEHFSLLYEAAEKNNADFVYTNFQPLVLDQEENIVDKWEVDDSDVTWEDIRIVNKINHSTILHTKALADKVGDYDEHLQIMIDFDYIKRLAKVAKPLHIHSATYLWNLRQNKNGQVSSISGLWDRDPEAAWRSLATLLGKDLEALAICWREYAKVENTKKELLVTKDQNTALTIENKELWRLFHEKCDNEKKQSDYIKYANDAIEHLNGLLKEQQDQNTLNKKKKKKYLRMLKWSSGITVGLMIIIAILSFHLF